MTGSPPSGGFSARLPGPAIRAQAPAALLGAVSVVRLDAHDCGLRARSIEGYGTLPATDDSWLIQYLNDGT